MTLLHTVTIRCNTCGTPYRPPTRATTGADARAQAATAGWTNEPGQDHCPTCTTTNRPNRKRPRGTCTACGRDKTLTDNGLIYQHSDGRGTARPFGWCEGGEQPPAAEKGQQ